MNWWIFFPALYVSLAANLIFGDWLQWRGVPADVLFCLWSVVAMRLDTRRSIPQAAILGLLRDLGTGASLGASALTFVVITWLFGTLLRSEKYDRRLWLFWALPIIFLGWGATHVVDCYYAGVEPMFVDLVAATFWSALATYSFGCLSGLAVLAVGRLTMPRSFRQSDKLETTSFFLSR
ncbi:MAG: hypothetical protein HUJ26_13745 [Planctomycetaceae bacterium]|nr:hypothetical protein [Planctomycetaceae bacterium]